MKIHEYQAKQILAKYGVPVPRGSVAYSVDEATRVAHDFETEVCVVKAQIMSLIHIERCRRLLRCST